MHCIVTPTVFQGRESVGEFWEVAGGTCGLLRREYGHCEPDCNKENRPGKQVSWINTQTHGIL